MSLPKTLLAIAMALMLSPIAGAEPSTPDDEATLRHLKTVLWPQAYRTQDTGLLDDLLDDSFQLIDAGGNRSTKAGELAWIAENAWNPGEFEYRIERLDIYPNGTAIVAGEGVASDYSYRSSNVLVKRNGQWKAISSHVSGYTPKGKSEDP